MDRKVEEQIAELQHIVDTHSRIVFFGGAGVSTESGIPDFRSQDGLYHMQYKYPPETIISHTFFMEHTEEFYRFYKDKMLITDVEPNAAHRKLAEMEKAGKLELHGSIHRNYCMSCHKFFDAEYVKHSEGVPRCDACGGLIKPDVVLYEEGLDMNVLNGAATAIANADCLIIGGTSLVVYPAAGLIDYFRGDSLVLINKSATSRDRMANLVIAAPIGEVLSKIKV